jgi:hypothetical protein
LISPTVKAPRDSDSANRKRRLAMLRRHHEARGPDGKSQIAVVGGMAAARVNIERHPGGPSAFGYELALRRWHQEIEEEDSS